MRTSESWSTMTTEKDVSRVKAMTPGDIAGWGLCVIIVGVFVFGLLAAALESPWVFAGAAITGTIGSTMIFVGLIAWAVRLGARAPR